MYSVVPLEIWQSFYYKCMHITNFLAVERHPSTQVRAPGNCRSTFEETTKYSFLVLQLFQLQLIEVSKIERCIFKAIYIRFVVPLEICQLQYWISTSMRPSCRARGRFEAPGNYRNTSEETTKYSFLIILASEPSGTYSVPMKLYS